MSDNNWKSRYGLIDWRACLLTPEQILEKCKTEEGAREVKEYILRARIAFAAQSMMERMGVCPPAEVQQEVCMLLWDTLFRVPIDNVMAYARQVADGLEKEDDESIGGHC